MSYHIPSSNGPLITKHTVYGVATNVRILSEPHALTPLNKSNGKTHMFTLIFRVGRPYQNPYPCSAGDAYTRVALVIR